MMFNFFYNFQYFEPWFLRVKTIQRRDQDPQISFIFPFKIFLVLTSNDQKWILKITFVGLEYHL